jgi:uncharacterized protein (DUF362 family)
MKTEAQIDSAPSEACSYVLACPCPEGYGSGDYAPRTRFPELREIAGESGDNAIHGSLRDIFLAAGLDAGRYGSQQWNPLGQWIAPGMRVLIKPNWVKHETGDLIGQNVLCTHPSVLRAAIDYVLIATGSPGQVMVADSPLQGADFARVREQAGIDTLERHYRNAGLPVVFRDLRLRHAEVDDRSSYVKSTHPLAGDAMGYSIVDLGALSRLEEISDDRTPFEVADYNGHATRAHHRRGVHEYCIANSALSCDVILNLPKLKSHVKSGMTGAMKNFVGVNCDKAYLPHYRRGAPDRGGDEYPAQSKSPAAIAYFRRTLQNRAPLWLWKTARSLAFFLLANGKRNVICQSGGWYGNDTLWRTIHDLCDIVTNYGVGGTRLCGPRSILTLVDAMVCGEGLGPLYPRSKPLNLLIWGEDIGAVDLACAAIMGFDPRRIPMLSHLEDARARAFSRGAHTPWLQYTGEKRAEPPFAPPPTWKGHIEAGSFGP